MREGGRPVEPREKRGRREACEADGEGWGGGTWGRGEGGSACGLEGEGGRRNLGKGEEGRHVGLRGKGEA